MGGGAPPGSKKTTHLFFVSTRIARHTNRASEAEIDQLDASLAQLSEEIASISAQETDPADWFLSDWEQAASQGQN